MILAFASPTTAASSSADASRIRFTLLNSLSNALFRLFTDTFYLVQCGGNLPFAALVAVEGDGEAVYFILNLRQQSEEGGVPVSIRWSGEGSHTAARKCGVCHLWQVLRWGCSGQARLSPLLRRSFALFHRR